MSENLYFITIIARALQEQDVEKALRKAFREIKKKGTQKQYAEGFRNFELFMDAAFKRSEITITDHVHELITQLGTGMFEGTAQEMKLLLEILRSHPEWETEYETILRMEVDEHRAQKFTVIEVSNDRGLVIERTFKKVPGRESFEGILPANYRIKLVNTGWIIWDGKLTAEELIRIALDMAAETKGISKRCKSKIDLLNNGELILRTYPGMVKGRIEIELTR